MMNGQALVSLTFDDGFRCQFEKALPILNSYGIPATFFLNANQNQTHDLWSSHTNDWWKIDWRDEDIAMLKKLVQNGHEIGSHSVTHDPNKMPTQPDVEARESKRLIESWLGSKVSSFCYPFYHTHAYLANAMKPVSCHCPAFSSRCFTQSSRSLVVSSQARISAKNG